MPHFKYYALNQNRYNKYTNQQHYKTIRIENFKKSQTRYQTKSK